MIKPEKIDQESTFVKASLGTNVYYLEVLNQNGTVRMRVRNSTRKFNLSIIAPQSLMLAQFRGLHRVNSELKREKKKDLIWELSTM